MYAIVPAAGSGSRMGLTCSCTSKVLLELGGGECILELTLRSLVAAEVLKGIVVACKKGDQVYVDQLLSKICPKLDAWSVEGGEERQESVHIALSSIEDKSEHVLVHDGARPLCPPDLIRAVVEKSAEVGSAILAVPAKSTLKKVVLNGNTIVRETIPRDTIWEAQTPQVFTCSILKAAHDKAIKDDFKGTDDSCLVERLGHEVQVVKGSYSNVKVTTVEDLGQVKLFLKNR